MNILNVIVLSACLIVTGITFKAEAEESSGGSAKIQTQELIGRVVSIDLKNSSFDVNYEANEETHEMQTSTFYVTDITTIDIAMVKGSLNDLKPGLGVFLEYAQMPDGTKVVESVWVKKS